MHRNGFEEMKHSQDIDSQIHRALDMYSNTAKVIQTQER